MSQLFPSNRDLTDREVVADAAADLRRAEQAGGEAQMAAWARKWAAAAVQALGAQVGRGRRAGPGSRGRRRLGR